MLISIIVAVADNGVIGKDNQLLWRLPDDLKRFKQLTLGRPMIMGRKTYESIGKPLPGRTSIIVTRDSHFQAEHCIVTHSLEEAIEAARKIETEETFIIGGGELYKQAQAIADKMYVTEVHTNIAGDTWFEIQNPDNWHETERIVREPDEKHLIKFEFVNYSKQTD